jgi:RNA polymerase sigma factor (sigma-70 family)
MEFRREAHLAQGGQHSQEISDIELINGVVARKPGYFNLFYNKYVRLVLHCIRTRARGYDSEEILQDFFAKLEDGNYRKLDLWNRNSSLTNYLSVVVRNFTIDWMRSNRMIEQPMGSSEDMEILIGEDRRGNPETILESRMLRRSGIRAWLGLKSKRDRRLICHKYHRDTSNESLAQIEGLSPGAIRKAFFDAHKRYFANLKLIAPEYFPSEA